MEKYIGTKLIQAELMNKYEFFMNVKKIDCKEDNQQGYLVEYEGGYISWSPKDVFEKAYRRLDNLTFGLVIEALKMKLKIARKGWNGKGLYIEMQFPDANSKMTRPYIYLVCPKGSTKHFGDDCKEVERIPWIPGQNDILAEDWEVIE